MDLREFQEIHVNFVLGREIYSSSPVGNQNSDRIQNLNPNIVPKKFLPSVPKCYSESDFLGKTKEKVMVPVPEGTSKAPERRPRCVKAPRPLCRRDARPSLPQKTVNFRKAQGFLDLLTPSFCFPICSRSPIGPYESTRGIGKLCVCERRMQY